MDSALALPADSRPSDTELHLHPSEPFLTRPGKSSRKTESGLPELFSTVVYIQAKVCSQRLDAYLLCST